MAIETEVKAKCKNLAVIRKRLKEIGAKFTSKKYQIDTYYLVKPKKSKYHFVPLIRVREDLIKKQFFLEYHQPLNIYQAKEHEIEINEPKTAKVVLAQLNYPLAAIVKKNRESYAYAGLNIDLDVVEGLGKFIEVECMKNQPDSLKRIHALLEQLGVRKIDLIPKERYVDIMWARRQKNKKRK